jgi:hypothetical protein
MTVRPLHWEAWCNEHLGDLYGWLKTRALGERNPKLPEVVARLQDRWDRIERTSAAGESA